MYENTLPYENDLIHSMIVQQEELLTRSGLPLTVPNTIMALSRVNRPRFFVRIPSRAVAESTVVHITIHVVITTYGP